MLVHICCFKSFTSFWASKVSELHLYLIWGRCVMLPGRILDLAQHKTSRAVWATAPWWDEPFHPLSIVLCSSETFHHFCTLLVPVGSWTGAPRSSSGPFPSLLSQPFQVPESWNSAGTKETSQQGGTYAGNWSFCQHRRCCIKRTSLSCVFSCVGAQAWFCASAARAWCQAGNFSSWNFHLNIVFLSQPVTLKARWNPARTCSSQQITLTVTEDVTSLLLVLVEAHRGDTRSALCYKYCIPMAVLGFIS